MDQVDLLKFADWAARGIPPRRFGYVLYDYGGVVSLADASHPAFVDVALRSELFDAVLAHARRRRNAFLAAWLSHMPTALWRFIPPPRVKRRIIIIDRYNSYRESKNGEFAVAWIETPCCRGFAWSYPYAFVTSKMNRYVPPVLW